jgi:CheY-like chemotaxis protein
MNTLNFPGYLDHSERVIFSADDCAADRLLFARLLEQRSPEYLCDFFTSGEEMIGALITVLRGAPAPLACFIDVRMGGMSGIDVLRWIRCQNALEAMPVIMLSSSDDPQTLSEVYGYGAQCFVSKFPNATELRAVLAEAERYAQDRATPLAFHLPCNLLGHQTSAAAQTAVA